MLDPPSLAPMKGEVIRFVSQWPPMITTGEVVPGIVPTILVIGIGPIGVVAVNASSLTWTLAIWSSSMMNDLQRCSAGEPEGRS